ncbi:MAG: sigma-70 family RNA polymerase sigma factor [Ignavibacteria bacterium]|nr:sigma-70 family RNA polymerase sigma factor [Ignavibacteria bacterium]
MNKNISEQSLLELSKDGDKDAFGMIVKIYMERAYFSALALTHSESDALDLSQEAFVRAYKAMHSFKTEMKFFTWYYRILKNLFLNWKRDNAKFVNNSNEADEVLFESIEDAGYRLDRDYEKKELEKILWDEINSLDSQFREIIILKDFQNYSYQEIAEMLEIPLGTVMSRLYSARKKLKDRMKVYYEQ